MSARALWPFAVLAVVAFLPTWQFLFGGQVPAPVDHVNSLPPWNGAPADSPIDILQLDGALQFLPWRELMLVSYKKGEVPIWNDHVMGGIPFMANSQSAPLYPLHIAWGLTDLSAEALLSFSAWLHLWIAGCGMFLLCRRLGGAVGGALIGATAVMLSSFFIGWLQLPSVVMTASWIPWAMVGVLRLFEEPTGKSVAKLALAIALMLLSGHLQIAMYGLLATGLYAIWLGASRRLIKTLAWVASALTFGLMVAAPQLGPVLENGREGHRAQPPTADGYRGYSALALTPRHLSVLVAPTVFGLPGEWVELEDGRAPSYWLSLEEQGRNYAELALYVGPVAIPLFLLGFAALWRRPEANFFGFLAVFALLVALGTFVTQAMYWGIPGWAATGSPGRIAILAVIAIGALAGAAIREDQERPTPVAVALAALFAAMLALFAFTQVAAEPQHPMQAASQASSLPWLIVFGIGACVAIACVSWRSLHAKTLVPICLLLAALAPAVAQRSVNPGADKGLFKQPFEGLEHLKGKLIAVVNDQWSLLGPGPMTIAPPNSLLPYGIRTLDGYDSLVPRKTKAVLDGINGQDSAPLANGNMMLIKPGFDPAKLRAAGVSHVISRHDLDLPVEESFPNWKLYRVGDVPSPESGRPATPRTYTLGLLLAMVGVFALFAISYRRNADSDTS